MLGKFLTLQATGDDFTKYSLFQNQESDFELRNNRGEKTGTVKLLSKYVPVPAKIEPRESINSE